MRTSLNGKVAIVHHDKFESPWDQFTRDTKCSEGLPSKCTLLHLTDAEAPRTRFLAPINVAILPGRSRTVLNLIHAWVIDFGFVIESSLAPMAIGSNSVRHSTRAGLERVFCESERKEGDRLWD
jgi:hypothetical protein